MPERSASLAVVFTYSPVDVALAGKSDYPIIESGLDSEENPAVPRRAVARLCLTLGMQLACVR